MGPSNCNFTPEHLLASVHIDYLLYVLVSRWRLYPERRDRYWNGQIAIFLRLPMRDKRIIVHRLRPCGRYAVCSHPFEPDKPVPLQTSDRCDDNWLSVHPPEPNHAWHHKSSQVKLQSPQTATHPLHPAEIPLSVLSFMFNAFFFFGGHNILK